MATSQSGLHRGRHQDDGGDAKEVNMESMLSGDLQDWLRLTNWHDTDFRQKELSNYRWKEEQKPGKMSNMGKHQTHDRPAKVHDLIPILHAEGYRRHDSVGTQRPRARSTSPLDSRRNKHTGYRIRDYPESRSMDHSQVRVDNASSTSRRRRLTDPSAQVVASPFGSDHRSAPSAPGPTDSRDFARERVTRRRPKPFKVGDKETVRFFVMRSGSWSNVYSSMEDGVWATNASKADQLGEILSSGITVVLFFAVNHSHGFQGYAVMKSAPSKEVHHPKWWYNVRWTISEPFKVDWIVTEHVETTRVTHIMNGLNYDLPVTRSSNGQELSYSAGLQMVAIIDAYARDVFARTERSRRHA
ncbi:YTH-domain-containing protein [Annulohypoxylon moriforme]|nr:YTH-domain-containing protein [Annulohypoxylon moriforme]